MVNFYQYNNHRCRRTSGRVIPWRIRRRAAAWERPGGDHRARWAHRDEPAPTGVELVGRLGSRHTARTSPCPVDRRKSFGSAQSHTAVIAQTPACWLRSRPGTKGHEAAVRALNRGVHLIAHARLWKPIRS